MFHQDDQEYKYDSHQHMSSQVEAHPVLDHRTLEFDERHLLTNLYSQ